ncbi:zinc ABC transporter ATP-binding protein AztA [Chelatococcus reniformis]|uniref:ABC transporter ATP-binding protein n=1 Tax=Chelatococcus reniformis TaxID=1494448 RepID=A0A916U9I6_9HYPH|nr:zinc ABC transporter ATP-binding protein AztA [Chelatococcus reniformis]GGC63580.1 ABC transporter ATP-binding protein [Chelatococcus reniformis]
MSADQAASAVVVLPVQAAPADGPVAVRFDNVTLGYDRHPAVHHLDGALAGGSLTAVVGPNGAGKSTLLKSIAGLIKPLGGRIRLGQPRERVAYLPQLSDLDRSFPIGVYDLVAMGLWHRVGVFGRIGRREAGRIEDAIAAVGLTGFERRPIGKLSGGQLQRALFARLLVQDAALIVLDEPFNALDAKTTADLLDLVHRWHREERTVIAALHDLATVEQTFPETLLIAREPVAWGRTASVLTPENLLSARRMIEASDPHARACDRAA